MWPPFFFGAIPTYGVLPYGMIWNVGGMAIVKTDSSSEITIEQVLTPRPSMMWGLAPFSNRHFTVLTWPLSAAQCRGVN